MLHPSKRRQADATGRSGEFLMGRAGAGRALPDDLVLTTVSRPTAAVVAGPEPEIAP